LRIDATKEALPMEKEAREHLKHVEESSQMFYIITTRAYGT